MSSKTAVEVVASKTAEAAHDAVDAGKEAVATTAAVTKRILHWDELPTWMQVDSSIQRGYRRQLNSFRACFASLFYAHNELVNVWSHLLPSMLYVALFLAIDYYAVLEQYGGLNSVDLQDKLVLQLYIAGTAGCLFFSAFYHCVNSHSKEVATSCLKLDYLGIVLSISVSSISSTFFGMHDEPTARTTYMLLTLTFAIAVFYNLLGPNADGPTAKSWRVAILVSLFLTGFLPIIHRLVLDGTAGLATFPLKHTALTTGCYLVGTIFYVSHFPEKYMPNTFDIWGASHQIWHTLIATGQTVFLFGLITVMPQQQALAIE